MKTDDLLLYGGGALLLYLLLKPKQVAPGVTQMNPVYSALPPVSQPNTGTSVLTALSALVPVAEKYLLTPKPFIPQTQLPVAEATAGESIYTPPLTSTLPNADNYNQQQFAYQPQSGDSLLEMFQNGDYPGAQLSGLANYEAARIGIY